MKKLLLLFGVLIIIGCLQAYAAKCGVHMDFYNYGHESKSTTVHRSPMMDLCLNRIRQLVCYRKYNIK
jgi:hypothetical protein